MYTRTLFIKATRYLQDTLGDEAVTNIETHQWRQVDLLPFFLQTLYHFYLLSIYDQPCLAVVATTPEGESPATVRKHLNTIRHNTELRVLYVIQDINSFNRKRLIEQGVPFLVPGRQLYLPGSGIDLRESFTQTFSKPPEKFSLPAQLIVLRELLHGDCSGKASRALAELLRYSPMSITRAIKELSILKFVQIEAAGRERHIRFKLIGRELWEQTQPLMQSPVKNKVRVAARFTIFEPPFHRAAGECALAHYTDLIEPSCMQRCMSQDEWQFASKRANIKILQTSPSAEQSPSKRDEGIAELEIWAYDPDVLAIDGAYPDPLSLLLSLETEQDDRIDIAKDQLINNLWKD